MRKRTNRNVGEEVRREWIEIKDSRTKEKTREMSKIKEKVSRNRPGQARGFQVD